MKWEFSPMQLARVSDFSFLRDWDTIRIMPEPSEYHIVLMDGSTGDWDSTGITFEAGSDAEANAYAEEHHSDLDWYILNNDGANING